MIVGLDKEGDTPIFPLYIGKQMRVGMGHFFRGYKVTPKLSRA